MKKPTYTELLKSYYDQVWEADFRIAYGDIKRAKEAAKKMTRIEKRMWNFKSENVFKSI